MKEGEKGEEGQKEEKVYHIHCLTCSYCTNTIEGKFFTQDGSVVCGPCASDQVITQAVHKTKLSKSWLQVDDKTCDICSRAIDGDCLISKGKHFHQDCMKVGVGWDCDYSGHHVCSVLCVWRGVEWDILHSNGQAHLWEGLQGMFIMTLNFESPKKVLDTTNFHNLKETHTWQPWACCV